MQPEDENGGKKKQKNGGSLGVVVQQRASKVIFLLRPAAVDMKPSFLTRPFRRVLSFPNLDSIKL